MFEHLFKTEEELEKLTPKERASYQYNLKYYRDLKNVTDTAREEGRAEGLAKAKMEAIAKGRMEVKMSIAKNLKVIEFPIEQIMQATGLSRAEIEAL